MVKMIARQGSRLVYDGLHALISRGLLTESIIVVPRILALRRCYLEYYLEDSQRNTEAEYCIDLSAITTTHPDQLTVRQ